MVQPVREKTIEEDAAIYAMFARSAREFCLGRKSFVKFVDAILETRSRLGDDRYHFDDLALQEFAALEMGLEIAKSTVSPYQLTATRSGSPRDIEIEGVLLSHFGERPYADRTVELASQIFEKSVNYKDDLNIVCPTLDNMVARVDVIRAQNPRCRQSPLPG